MSDHHSSDTARHILLLTMIFMLSACGGTDESDNTAVTTPDPNTSVVITPDSGTAGTDTSETFGTSGTTSFTKPEYLELREPADTLGFIVTLTETDTGELTAKVSAGSQDDLQRDLLFYWHVNDSIIGLTETPFLPTNTLQKGDRVNVSLLIDEGGSTKEVESNYITVNNAPINVEITLSPEQPVKGDVVVAELRKLYDYDGDGILNITSPLNADDYSEVTYQWSVNEEPLPGETNSSLAIENMRLGDKVTLKVTLKPTETDSPPGTETEFQDVVVSTSLFVADSPSDLDTSNVPESLPFGEATSFSTQFVDPDGTPVVTEFVAGPHGLLYDAGSGQLSWTPRPAMFLPQESYSAIFRSSDGVLEAIKLKVVNQQHQPVIARSGIDVPKRANNIRVVDLDNDSIPELLTTDSDNQIFTLELAADNYVQDWLYPFEITEGRDIVNVFPIENESPQVLVITTTNIMLIAQRDELARELYKVDEGVIHKADYIDVDNDGLREFILLRSGDRLQIVDSQSFEIEHNIPLSVNPDSPVYSNDTWHITVGNVDEDNALEIVTDSGNVIDGNTGITQWTHTENFGNPLAIGDVNGDGINEIVAVKNGNDTVSYSATTRSELGPLGFENVCDLEIFNLDSDPQDEIILSGCYSEPNLVVDVANDPVDVQQTLGSRDTALNLTLGDLDGDSISELIWVTGTNISGGTRHFVTAALSDLQDPSPATPVKNENPAHIGFNKLPHIAPLTTHPVSNKTAIMFMAGATGGTRLVVMDEDGSLSLSPVIDPHLHADSGLVRRLYSDAGVVITDTNQDNRLEVIYAAEADRSGDMVRHKQVDDLSEINTFNSIYAGDDSDIEKLLPGTLDDGTHVALIVTDRSYNDDDSRLQVVDIQSNSEYWLSPPYTEDIAHAELYDTEDGKRLLIGTADTLDVWREASDGFTLESSLDVSCRSVAPVTIDERTVLACPYQVRFANRYRLRLLGRGLLEIADSEISSSITNLTAIPGARNGNLLAVVDRRQLVMLDPTTGFEIWRSPELLSDINGLHAFTDETGLNNRLSVSTSKVMYLSR